MGVYPERKGEGANVARVCPKPPLDSLVKETFLSDLRCVLDRKFDLSTAISSVSKVILYHCIRKLEHCKFSVGYLDAMLIIAVELLYLDQDEDKNYSENHCSNKLRARNTFFILTLILLLYLKKL